MADKIKVFFDMTLPGSGEAESGLFRSYFKYSGESLSAFVEPIFAASSPSKPVRLWDRMRVKKQAVRYHLPFSSCRGADNAAILHLFLRFPVCLRRPWISECECVDQFAGFYGHNARCESYVRRLRAIMERDEMRRMIVPSLASKNGFEALGLPLEKVRVLYPGLRCTVGKHHFENQRVRLLFNFGSGALFFSKGGREVLDSFKILKKKFNRLELVICGRDSQGKVTCPEGVTFRGYVPHKTYMKDLLPTVDILVHPTHMDTIGFVVLEAMAAGLPIVATKHYAIPEIIEERANGYLIDDIRNVWYDEAFVPKPNYRQEYHAVDRVFAKETEHRHAVEQLVFYLEKLIEDPELRNRIGNSNRQKVSEGKFSVDRRNEELFSMYRDAISRK